MSYYVDEIASYAVRQEVPKPQDVGRLGTSATHLGMGKIRASTWLGKYAVDFLNQSTIHGLNHLVAPHRHFVERFLTVLFLGVALACLIASSLFYWYQYQDNPTTMVVDIDKENFNITKPAITICLNDKVSEEKFPEVFKKFGIKDTQEARNFFTFISDAVYEDMPKTPIYSDTSPDKWLQVIRDLYVGLERNRCSSTKPYCKDYDAPTTDIITERGMCTTVYGTYGHYSSVDYWLADNWTITPQEILPSYTFDYQQERITLKNIPGAYKLNLHHPNELPFVDGLWYEYAESGLTNIKIDVLEIESSNSLKMLSERQRPCKFPEDGSLKMFPVYTHNMCVLERRYNLFRSKCGCYPHFARPMPGIAICNATQLRCIGNIASEIASAKQKHRHLRHCPDTCNTIRYRRIASASGQLPGFDWVPDSIGKVNNRPLNVDLQFPDHKLRHEVFFGFNEFLVSVGGAAGLFLGASIMSFIEILYYITLRLFWHKNNKLKHK